MAAKNAHGSTDDENRKRRLSQYLPFEATETPKWGKKEDVSVQEMIEEILSHLREWEEIKGRYDKELIDKVQKQFLVELIFHVNMEEEKGFSTFEETDEFLTNFYARNGSLQRQLSIKEQETLNLRNAYEHLLAKIKKEERSGDYGLVEASLLKETHGMLMKGIEIPKDKTKPGIFSKLPRKTEYKGEEYKSQESRRHGKCCMQIIRPMQCHVRLLYQRWPQGFLRLVLSVQDLCLVTF